MTLVTRDLYSVSRNYYLILHKNEWREKKQTGKYECEAQGMFNLYLPLIKPVQAETSGCKNVTETTEQELIFVVFAHGFTRTIQRTARILWCKSNYFACLKFSK